MRRLNQAAVQMGCTGAGLLVAGIPFYFLSDGVAQLLLIAGGFLCASAVCVVAIGLAEASRTRRGR